MKQRLYISEYLTQDDLNKQMKGKLLNYKDFKEVSNREEFNPFYYNEEEKNKVLDEYARERKEKQKTNIIYNHKKEEQMENNNNNFQKKKSFINFVVKEEKNKNLKLNKINEDYNNMKLYLSLYKKKNQNNIKKDKENNFIKNTNQSEKLFYKFNEKHLANMNTNIINLISQQIIEIPTPNICYFTREIKSGKELIFSKPILLSKNKECYYKKIYIYNDKRVSIPKAEICYYKKLFIFYPPEPKITVLNKRFFCTKIKIKLKKHKRKKLSAKEENNLKNKNLKGLNNKKSLNNDKTRNKRKSPKKGDIKFKSYQNNFFDNNKLKSFKTIYQYDINEKYRHKNDKIKKNSFLFKSKNKPKTKSKSSNNKRIKKNNFPDINKEQNDSSSTSSSNERGRKHSSLFRHLNNKKDGLNELLGLQKNKVLLHKRIPNGYDFSRNNNRFFIPKINNTNSINISHKVQKTKISPNIRTSKDLIKKINEEVVLNNKNHHIFNSYETPSYHIMNYNHKDIENNFIKCDIHYNTSNLLCSKCQQSQLRINSFHESNSQIMPNINKHLLNNNHNNQTNKNINKIQSDLVLTPTQIKNFNNRYDNGSIFDNIKNNNKSISLKKINLTKGNKKMTKNYKSGYLAIKEYFNIK